MPQQKSSSKLPTLLGVAIAILVLIFLVVGAKKVCAGATRKMHTVETEPDGRSVVTDTEEG